MRNRGATVIQREPSLLQKLQVGDLLVRKTIVADYRTSMSTLSNPTDCAVVTEILTKEHVKVSWFTGERAGITDIFLASDVKLNCDVLQADEQ